MSSIYKSWSIYVHEIGWPAALARRALDLDGLGGD